MSDDEPSVRIANLCCGHAACQREVARAIAASAEKDAPVGYVRDRSFYPSRPSGSHAPKIHRESVTRRGMAACDTSYVLLDTDRPIALVDDAAQRARWCLRCFPVGQHYDFPPGRRS